MENKIKIGLDMHGGDGGIEDKVTAIKSFLKNNENCEVVMFGNEKEVLAQIELSENIKLVATTEKIENEDSPALVVKHKKDSSMVVGSEHVKANKIDAFISAGNTGALVACGVFIIKRIKGISRPSLGAIFPGGTYLNDIGANIDPSATDILNQAIIGTIYMEQFIGKKNPKTALLNVGTEPTKGRELEKEVFKLLEESSNINFVGNIEARNILSNDIDVIVMDGFTGNIILKSVEGVAKTIGKKLKEIFYTNLKTKFSALLLKKDLEGMIEKMDYHKYGGTPVMGIEGILMKTHGSSNSLAFEKTMEQAKKLAEINIIKKIKDSLE